MPETEEPASAVFVAAGDRRSNAAVLCKKKASAPGKKLVQARLPFKRLNPVPKEKEASVLDVKKAKTSQNASRQNSLPKLNKSLENDCQLGTEMVSPPPKTTNATGPLDHFLKRRKDNPAVMIDLTEDSNSAQFDQGASTVASDVQKEATARIENITPSKPVLSCKNDDFPMETDVVVQKTGATIDHVRSGSPVLLLGGEGLTMSQEERALIFKGKKPVVVLEDIMISKPSLLGSLDGIVVTEEDKLEKKVVASPEVELDSPTHSTSPASSPLAGSSSEAGVSPATASGQENKNRISPSSFTTPVRKITSKISKPSSEKRQKEQEERRKKIQTEKEERDRLKEEAKNAKERAKEEAKKIKMKKRS